MKTFLQVLVGMALCAAITYAVIYSPFPIFWEHEEPLQPHVYSFTWRSGVMLALVLGATQTVAALLFRKIRSR